MTNIHIFFLIISAILVFVNPLAGFVLFFLTAFSIGNKEDKEEMLHLQKQNLASTDETITGFNVGIIDGEDAGQTVMHCHIHLIPRRNGDMENPRGGVRGVIPEKQSY